MALIEDASKWKNHFLNQARSKTSKKQSFYVVQHEQKGGATGPGPKIELVTPTKQALDQAESEVNLANKLVKAYKKQSNKKRSIGYKKTASKTSTSKKRRKHKPSVFD